MSKFSLPYLNHMSVPKTWFLDRMEKVPDDLEHYILKPLFSFAGLGVNINPTKADLRPSHRKNARNTFCRSA